MMKEKIVLAVVMIMMLSANKIRAGVSVVENGSFEEDGTAIADITAEIPHGWDDVNMPSGWFGGSVYADWATHGDYYLNLYTYAYGTFAADETITISQQVYLADVNQIIFDVKLDTTYGDPWDPAKRTAVMLIDGTVVWESNSVGADVGGDYFDQTVDVNGIYDASPHTLTLGLRANMSETSYVDYRTQWDFVRFDTYCEGFGFLQGDINLDCYVDWLDLEMLAGQWLVESPAEKYDLFQDANNIVNFNDFAVLADSWMANSYELDSTLMAMDLNYDGIVNFIDYAILAEDWSSGAADYNDIAVLADEWLQTN